LKTYSLQEERKMKRTYLVFSALAALVLLATACGPQATPTAAPATQAATQPAVVPVTGGTTVAVGKNDALGSFLVDDKGMTLYLFTKDTPGTSVCYDKCATAWPPLLTTGKPVAGDGADASMLGTTTRKDGTTQVTYNGWPLYYYFKDETAGDVTGQNVGEVWFVVSPAGDMIKTAVATEAPAATQAATEPAMTEPAATGAAAMGAATVNLGKNDKLGSFLVDDKGMTLYLFTKDTPNTSVCYDKCATAWPPLLTTGAPVAGDGVDAAKFGTTTRKDGTTQVTYNGWPLYYYFKDKASGDVTGQTVGDVWYVVSPAGDQITTAP
jgi:predicted lipoprotein with Yx(FWY)xxD motif